ncbi:MAG: sulfatase-like hydrolase/transferase [Woeseiaceae bacterium]
MRKPSFALVFLALVPLACSAETVEDDSPPNFIIMIGDDMAVETVGCYGVGSTPAKTPTIDQLCDDGMRFDNFWSQPVCSPTRATILTGQYGFRNGVGTPATHPSIDYPIPDTPDGSPSEGGARGIDVIPGEEGGGGNRRGEGRPGGNRNARQREPVVREGYTEPADERPSISIDAYGLPTALRADASLAYEAAAFGKWHLASEENGALEHPQVVGFDHYSGNFNGGGVESYFAWSKVIDGEVTDGKTGYVTSDTVDDAIGWIAERDGDSPWLAWVAFNAPHSPFGAPPVELLSEETVAALAAADADDGRLPNYLAMIEAMDTEIARLLASVDPAELANTYVIFMGDNGTPGEAVTAPFTRGRAKGTVYQGGVNVPFVVAGPGIDGGEVTQALANSVDLYATILDLAGTAANEKLAGIKQDSISLTPVLRQSSTKVRDYAYVDHFGPTRTQIVNRHAIRDDQYKIIVDLQDNTKELYDLSVDPYESVDLLQETLDEETEVRYHALLAQLEQLRASK